MASAAQVAIDAEKTASIGAMITGGVKILAGVFGAVTGGPAGAAAGEEAASAVTS